MSKNNHETDFAVLFVDDEEKTLKNFSKLISSQYQVLTATNIKDAQQILDEKHDHIGVLITDQRMPGGNGVELLAYTQKHYPEIVRLLTTAYSDLNDAIAAINQGEIFRYLGKPWDIRVLQADIHSAMKFFQLKQDRDALVKEKLSVLTQSAAIDCMRHLIVIGHSNASLRFSAQAVQAFLSMLIAQKNSAAMEQLADSNLDYWNLTVTETDIMAQVANKTLSELDKQRTFDDNLSVEDWNNLLQAQLKPYQHKLNIADDLHMLTGSKHSIDLALQSFFNLINTFQHKETAIDISLNNDEKTENAIQLRITVNNVADLVEAGKQALVVHAKNSETSVDYFANWLSLFLLVHDHAGQISTKTSDETNIEVDITLLNYEDDSKAAKLSANWIEDIFVNYT